MCNREYIDKQTYNTLIENITTFKKDILIKESPSKRKKQNSKKKLFSKSTKHTKKISSKSKIIAEEEKKMDLSQTSSKLDKSSRMLELTPKNAVESKDSVSGMIFQIMVDNHKRKKNFVHDPIYEIEEDDSRELDSSMKSNPVENNKDNLIKFFKSNIKDETWID